MDNNKIQHILKNHRQAIDELDDKIIALLAQRITIIRTVAGIKKQHNIPSRLPDRVEQVINRNVENAKRNNLDSETIRQVWTTIIDNAIATENEIL